MHASDDVSPAAKGFCHGTDLRRTPAHVEGHPALQPMEHGASHGKGRHEDAAVRAHGVQNGVDKAVRPTFNVAEAAEGCMDTDGRTGLKTQTAEPAREVVVGQAIEDPLLPLL